MSDSARPSILATTEDNNPANLSMAQNEEKHPIESIISESKRLLKSGLYKKAFNLIENHKNDLQNASPAASIKVHRRMVICLTRICDRYLSKGEVQRVEHFVRLMNKSFEYLEGWHGLLCNYISKTNPNYMHLQKLLDEVSDYDDGFEFANPMRAKFRKETMNVNSNASYMSTMESTKPSSFMTKLKQSTFIGRSKAGGAYLEDTNTGVTEGSRLMTENNAAAQAAPQGQSQPHVEKELNPTFHLDEFIKYFLANLLNWVTFYKRVAKKYDVAFRFLSIGYRISKILDVCLDADTLQIVAKARIALGAFFLEFGRHQEALLVFESTINVLHTELSLRLNKDKESKAQLKSVFKFKTTIRLLILTFINMSICFEQQDNYPRVLESLKLGLWFANRFTAPEDEAYVMLNTQYNNAMEKYDHFLKELGEVERVIGEPQITAPPGETEPTEKLTEHFGKINSYLYDKFDYEKLNTSQAIVFPAPLQGRRESTFKNRAEFLLEERNDSTDHKHSWTRGEASLGRTMMHTEGFDSPNGMGWKHNSGIMTKSSIKGKRKLNRSAKRLSSVGGEENRRPLTSDKYRKPIEPEKETLALELDDTEEQEFIEKLNRNIKDKTKSAKYRRGEGNFLDLDNYFNKVIEEKIQTKEEEMHIKPMGFKQIVKNYAYFDRNEHFDKVEFSFAARTLSSKAKENLGDYDIDGKFKSRISKFAQVNEVKIEAQLLEARNEAEAKLANRNGGTRGLLTAKAGSGPKTVKFASQIDLDSKASLAVISEKTPNTTKHSRAKPSFSTILLKHKDDLGLKVIHQTLKEREKYEKKETKQMERTNEMNMLGFGGIRSPLNTMPTPSNRKGGYGTPHGTSTRDIDPEQAKKNTTNANDMIQLLMESIEKTIENDVNIRKRIEDNKPLVEIKKASTRFLKVSDELAKSTVNLSMKLDGTKAKWNLSNVVKGMQAMKKKVMIRTATQDFH